MHWNVQLQRQAPGQTDTQAYLYITLYCTAAQRNPNPQVVIQMISFQWLCVLPISQLVRYS